MTAVPVVNRPGATFYPQGAVLAELSEYGRWMPAAESPSAHATDDVPAFRDAWSSDPDRTTRRGDVADPRVRAWLDTGWV